jgi:hypothetical protein
MCSTSTPHLPLASMASLTPLGLDRPMLNSRAMVGVKFLFLNGGNMLG